MPSVLSALPIVALVLSSTQPAPPEIGNVAAFARLYGVVRFFYPSDAAAELDWNRFAVLGPVDAELFPEGMPARGAHTDLELGSGLRARVPLALTEIEARLDPGRQPDLDALRAALAAVPGPASEPDLDQRLADVVVAWSVLRHFYPYWTEAGVDWDARLEPQLALARAAGSREAQRDALRSLVADARDGHGMVADALDKTTRAGPPVSLAVVGGRLVVVSSARPSEAPVGAVVTTVDGEPAAARLARAVSLASGTTQWRQVAGVWRSRLA